jgi:hypothetical protein
MADMEIEVIGDGMIGGEVTLTQHIYLTPHSQLTIDLALNPQSWMKLIKEIQACLKDPSTVEGHGPWLVNENGELTTPPNGPMMN